MVRAGYSPQALMRQRELQGLTEPERGRSCRWKELAVVGILDAILVPGEHGAQLRADGLDALVGVLLLQLLEVRGAAS